jgi:DNA-binding SARP family transcriptional activator
MKIQLRTLGSIDLVADHRPGVGPVMAQPKRFALLAYLAVAARRGFVRRDTLLALFWPETDQARGRNSLRQTVFRLRQSLGADVIRSRGDEELGVDPAIVESDVALFEEALAAGKPEEALGFYSGDFLVGFHVPDAAAEFEEWSQAEARRLRSLATNAAWTLASAQEQSGNADAAAGWARRALALDPLNEKRVTEVMQLLARQGDRAGALDVYQEYARRAAEVFGIEPTGAVQRIAQSLRTAPEPVATAAETSAPIPSDVSRPATEATISVNEPPRRRPSLRRRVLSWGAPALSAIVLGIVLPRVIRPPATNPVIAVGTITDATNGATEQPSNVPGDLLSTSLARLSGVHVIPVTRLYDVQSQLRAARRPATGMLAAAKQAGAEHLIEGTLHRLPDGPLQIDLKVMDARTGAVVRAHRAQGSDLYGTVDEATEQIARAYGVPAPKEGIAGVTTSSLVAYRLYDQGLHAYYQDDIPAAYRLFVAALAEDTTFAWAAYYAGAASADFAPAKSQALLLRAAGLADRATDRERLAILARVAWLRMSASASAFADTIGTRYPLDPDAQFALGHASERSGDFFKAALQYRRVIALDSLSLRRAARCLACDAYKKLWWMYVFADSASAAERVAREFAAARPTDSGPPWLLGAALARQSRNEEAWNAWQAMDSLKAGSMNYDLAAVQLAIRNGDFTRADDRLRRLLLEGTRTWREEAAWYLVISLRNQGRFREALALTAETAPVARPIVLLELGHAQEAARAFEAMVPAMADAPPGHVAKHQAWLFTHVATSLAAAGDTARLAALADTVQRLGVQSAFGRDARLHHYIRGLLSIARGQPQRAVGEFSSSIYGWSEGYTRANYELARTLIALKQPARAVYPLQAALRGDLESSNLYVTRTELHELLAQSFDLLGQRDSAASHYRIVISAWQRADPTFRNRLNHAKQRLEANARHSPPNAEVTSPVAVPSSAE